MTPLHRAVLSMMRGRINARSTLQPKDRIRLFGPSDLVLVALRTGASKEAMRGAHPAQESLTWDFCTRDRRLPDWGLAPGLGRRGGHCGGFTGAYGTCDAFAARLLKRIDAVRRGGVALPTLRCGSYRRCGALLEGKTAPSHLGGLGKLLEPFFPRLDRSDRVHHKWASGSLPPGPGPGWSLLLPSPKQ